MRDASRGSRSYSADDLWAAIEVVDWWRAEHARPLVQVNAGLRHYVQKVGAKPDISQRLKRFGTIVNKLERQPTMKLDTMEDIGGVRVILPRQAQVDAIVTDLRKQPRWSIRRVREYVAGRTPGPKEDGYRAVHLVVAKQNHYVEIQLRTPWQDSWAQSVEQDTRRLGHGLKFGAGPDDLRDYYRVIAECLELRELDGTPSQDLLDELSKLHRATRRYYREPGP